MKNVLNIFKQDMRNLKRVPLLILILLAVAVLPSLYAWFNLSSSWDPYSNTGAIPIAVVNEDEGAEIDGKTIRIGEEIVDNLKDNQDFSWKFLSKQEAEDGVKYGDVYATIYIGEGFSRNLVSALDGDPKQAEILFQVNEKINTIAPKMTSTGANAVVTKMNEKLIEETSKALFEQFDKLGIKVEEELPTMRKIKKIVDELEKSFPEINEFAERLHEVENGWDAVDERVNQFLALQNYFPKIEKGAELVYRLEEQFPRINQLGAQILKIEKSIPELEEAVQKLTTIGKRYTGVSEQLKIGLEQANGSKDAINNLQDAIPNLVEKSNQAEDYLKIIQDQNEQAQKILNDLTKLQEELDTLQEVLVALQDQLDNENMDPDKLATLREYSQEVEEASQELTELLNSEPSLTELNKRLEQSETNINDTFSELASLNKALGQASELIDTNSGTIESLIDTLPELEARINELISKTEEELPNVIQIIDTLAEFVQTDLPYMEEVVHQVAEMLRNDLPAYKEKYNDIASVLTEKVPEVEKSLHEINNYSREYLPEFEDVVHETADRFRKIEEEDQINRLIAILRNDLDKESEFFANPINLKEERLFEIPNYGSANAPFYTALSIWVGALLLSNLISTNVHPLDMRKEYTLRHVYFGKLILFLIVGLLQGLIVSLGNIFLLGVYAAHPVLYVIFSMFISIIFMTIVYTLASILGNIGKGLAIIILVLQLSSSGATFPVDVIPPFFQAIHPFVPFTYAINLLREAVGGAISIIVVKNISILLIFLVLALIVGVILKPLLAKRIEATVEKSRSSRMID